jgi:putative inorganic carbon (hco3(-)) transporter
MSARDLVMLLTALVCVPVAIYDAYYGLLAYCWLSIMRPQGLAWNPSIQSMRVVLVVAIVLIVRALLTKGPKVQFRGPTIAFLLLWCWFGVATLASADMALSVDSLVQFSKIGIGALLLTGLVRTRAQLHWLLVLLAFCAGFFGFKMGLYAVVSGSFHVREAGPAGMDNNDAAMFMAMAIPLLVCLAPEVANRWGRYLMYAAAGLTIPAVVTTGSRGGLLALGAAVFMTLWRRFTWWKAAIAGSGVLWLTLSLAPSETVDRYSTIADYEQDASAVGRLDAWKTAMAMAADRPLTGVGFGQDVFLQQFPNYRVREVAPYAAHSVWFSLLGETGYVGLGLYVCLILSALVVTHRVMHRAEEQGGGREDWAWRYAAGIQGAIATFVVGGTFLSQATFEFVLLLYAVTVPLAVIREREVLSGVPLTISRS